VCEKSWHLELPQHGNEKIQFYSVPSISHPIRMLGHGTITVMARHVRDHSHEITVIYQLESIHYFYHCALSKINLLSKPLFFPLTLYAPSEPYGSRT
jgi:hypothetical protein